MKAYYCLSLESMFNSAIFLGLSNLLGNLYREAHLEEMPHSPMFLFVFSGLITSCLYLLISYGPITVSQREVDLISINPFI